MQHQRAVTKYLKVLGQKVCFIHLNNLEFLQVKEMLQQTFVTVFSYWIFSTIFFQLVVKSTFPRFKSIQCNPKCRIGSQKDSNTEPAGRGIANFSRLFQDVQDNIYQPKKKYINHRIILQNKDSLFKLEQNLLTATCHREQSDSLLISDPSILGELTSKVNNFTIEY